MSNEHAESGASPEMTQNLLQFDQELDRFEAAWKSTSPPDIAEYLQDTNELSLRQQLLVELIAIDMEYRWRATAEARTEGLRAVDETVAPQRYLLEDYGQRFPEIASGDSLPLKLICAEYRIRCLWSRRPEHDEYAQRFPSIWPGLLSALTEIDRELSSTSDTQGTQGLSTRSGFHSKNVSVDLMENVATARVLKAKANQATRYLILRPHARGGLGEVFVAQDQELNREVALKEIRGLYSNQEEARNRFLREAEITGQLEHPGIVPIYGLGTYGDGRPFYAMRFIRGDSLKSAIEEFHKQTTSTDRLVGERLVKFRQLLGRFIDVCQAVHYAHSRLVLHRDLKPENIMLGKYGETLVVDWGLAKTLGESRMPVVPATDQPVIPSSGTPAETIDGSKIGTPEYMSPEQAAGKHKLLGPATDVYALGATMYCMLTGKPPFSRREAPDILAAMQQGAFKRPRELNPQLPRAVEAICLKAMALEPGDRYESAKAIAEDLEHWLADEPISAAVENVSERISRIGRRHRGAVLASGVALLLIAITSTVAGVVIDQQRRAAATLAGEMTELAERNGRLVVERTELASSEAKARLEVEYRLRISESQRLASQSENIRQALPIRSALLAAESTLLPYRHHEPIVDVAESAFHESLRVIGGYAMATNIQAADMCFSPDGRRLVIVGGSVIVLDLTADDPRSTAKVLRGHQGPVAHAAISSDGHWLVTGSWDGTARVWDLTAFDPSATAKVLRGHNGHVTSMALSADGHWLATAGRDNSARVWDLTSIDPSGRAIVLRGSFSSLGFSPEGTRLAAGGFDAITRVWDLSTDVSLQNVKLLNGHTGPVTCLTISPDGRTLVTGGDRTARIWDLTSVDPNVSVRVLSGYERGLRCTAFSPDGVKLITSGGEGTTKIWDLAAVGPDASPKTLRGHNEPVSCLAVSPDGHWLVTGSTNTDNTARVWDLTAEDPSATVKVLRGHDEPVGCLAISPDSRWLITGGNERIQRIWDLTSAQPSIAAKAFTADESFVRCLAVTADGRRLVTAGIDGTAKLWDLTSPDPVSTVKTLRGHAEKITCLTISPDARWLITGSEDATARIWDLSSDDPGLNATVLRQTSGPITHLAMSSDRRWLATCRALEEKSVQLWDLTAPVPNQAVRTFHGHDAPLSCLAISADGRWLATGTKDKTANVWDLTDPEPGDSVQTLTGHELSVECVAFSPDSRWLYTGSWDTTVRIWDLEANDPNTKAKTLAGSRWPITRITISPDGRWLVGASDSSLDKIVHVWDLKADDPSSSVKSLRGHDDAIRCLAISPDSHWLATSALFKDKTVRVWDLTADDPNDHAITLRGYDENVNCLAFSPDSRYLITGDFVGLACLRPLHGDQLHAICDHAVGRQLTEYEREQYGCPLNQDLASMAAPGSTVPLLPMFGFPVLHPRQAPPPPLATLNTRHRLLAKGACASWSPKGDRFVYANANSIFIHTIASNKSVELIADGKDPRWSPGTGEFIAFVRKSQGENATWIVPSKGGKPRRIGKGEYPQWLNDGRTVTFCAYGSPSSVYSADVTADPLEPKLICDWVRGYYPAVSPNGKWIAHQGPSGLAISQLSNRELIFSHSTARWSGLLPVWSRDSRYLTFGSYCNGAVNEMWLADVQQQRATRLVSGKFTMGELSSDGTKMLYDQRDSSGSSIWIGDLDYPLPSQ